MHLGFRFPVCRRPSVYNIRNAVRKADPMEMEKITVTEVYKHVAAFYYQEATSVGDSWGGKKNRKIDINILIEVKYREKGH